MVDRIIGYVSTGSALAAVMFAASMLDGLAGAPRYFYEYYALAAFVGAIILHLACAFQYDGWWVGTGVSLFCVAFSYGITILLIDQPYRAVAIASGAGVAAMVVPSIRKLHVRSLSYIRGVAAIGIFFALFVAYMSYRFLVYMPQDSIDEWRFIALAICLLTLSGVWPLGRIVSKR
ncbi:MAG: hypothetical protein AAGF25_11600 [Pseudomonadota bacterium]